MSCFGKKTDPTWRDVRAERKAFEPDVSKAMHNNTLKDSESSPAAKQGVTGCNFCFVEHVEHTKAAY